MPTKPGHKVKHKKHKSFKHPELGGLDNKEYRKWYIIKYKYGLTKEQYEDILISQNNSCAICHKENALVIDHCHDTGEIRGLLCNHCNVAVGFIQNNPEIANNMAKYLMK